MDLTKLRLSLPYMSATTNAFGLDWLMPLLLFKIIVQNITHQYHILKHDNIYNYLI